MDRLWTLVDLVFQADHPFPIVGDQSKIEPALRELPLYKTQKVLQFDVDFPLVQAIEREETMK